MSRYQRKQSAQRQHPSLNPFRLMFMVDGLGKSCIISLSRHAASVWTITCLHH